MSLTNITKMKELRELTGVGILEAKKILESFGGDVEKAVESLRERAQDRVIKLSARDAKSGVVIAKSGKGYSTLLTVNCETDFVAKTQEFATLTHQILEYAVENNVLTLKQLSEETRNLTDSASMVLKEKIEVSGYSRVSHADSRVAVYLHKTFTDLPAQAGAVVSYESSNSDEDLSAKVAREVAMQIVATLPSGFDDSDKYLRDPSLTVRELLDSHDVKIVSFASARV